MDASPLEARAGWMRWTIATNLLSCYDAGQDFIPRIAAIDKTWVRSYEPELRRQSAEWHTPNSLRPAKFRRVQTKLKMLMIYAFDI